MRERFRRTLGNRRRAGDPVRRVRAWLAAHPRTALASLGGLCAAAALVAALVVATDAPSALSPSASDDPASVRPSSTSSSSIEPSPAAPGTWTALTLAPYAPIADLAADATDGDRITSTAAFTIRSLGTASAIELAEHLVVHPAVELSVEAGATPDVATVRPTSPLIENAVYRFRLQDPNGALVDEWTFRTTGPLRVVRRLPEDRSTQVPVDTGIELEFDREGVAAVSDHFSIEPAVDGAFERHGRTWAFVPHGGFAPATLYTVTLRAGIHVEGTDQARLERDVQIAFETAARASASREPRVVFAGPLFEIRPGEPGVIPVTVHGDHGDADSLTRRVELFDLRTAAAAMDAAATLAIDRSWATWSSDGSVDTAGLRSAGSFDVVVRTRWNEQRMELPTPLAAGSYLIDAEQDGRHAQVVLQVTDLAAYLVTSDSRAIAWVNDLRTDAAVAGASLSLRDGTILGQTDAAGLLQTTTRTPLSVPHDGSIGYAPPLPELVLVTARDGAQVIAAVGAESGWFLGRQASSRQWWLVLGTDRLQYRTDDTIGVWGFIRSRADRSTPSSAEVRLLAGWDPYAPPITRAPITPTPGGTLLGELPVEDLPPGEYSVALFVGDDSVGQASVRVTEIRKPSMRIELESERHAYIHGETIAAQVRASFFDGSTAPGLELRVNGYGVNPEERSVKLGPDGQAKLSFEARASAAMPDGGSITAAPASPEEGASSGSTAFVVLPSNVWLTADAKLDGSTLTVGGTLSRVDLAAAEAQYHDLGWVDDPSGQPVAGRSVTVKVDRITYRQVQSGTTYDFLEKRAVPTYSYERRVARVGTFRPSSGVDGSFELAVPFDASQSAAAEITLRATDSEGRAVERTVWASATPEPWDAGSSNFPYLEQRVSCGSRALVSAGLDTTFEVNVRSGGDGAPSADGRTLFVVSRAGIDEVVITTGAGIERLFGQDDLPNVTIRAIRLTPSGYVVTNDVAVVVRQEDKTIEISLEADRGRYAPRDDITVRVTTTGPSGSPIAADVIVQAVDAKLHAIGAAQTPDPSGLMLPTGSGVAGSYATHRVTAPGGDGCGASTGGDEARDQFKDNATFQLVRTGADGRGSATFTAPDDLTSWVVSATAFSNDLDAGTASMEVPVGLPFFVDASIAPEYLVDEEPVIHLRAYGDSLAEGDAVRFTIEAPSLGLEDSPIDGQAFHAARIQLPALRLGDHVVTITAHGPGDLRDAVARTVRVVPTRLRTLQSAHETVREVLNPGGGDGMTTYVITDAGRGAVVPVLQRLAWSGSARLDAALAAELARQILIDEFGLSEVSVPPSGFGGLGAQPPEGLALMPHASADLFLTARTALVAPDQVSTDYIVSALSAALEDDPSRERSIVALAGLAGVGRDVLAELHAIDPAPLTVRERVWLAMGLLAAGDAGGARELERAVLAEHGQQLGGWVRLDAGTDTPETAETTAAMLLLAAGLRDPIAVDIARYLLENPSSEHLAALEQLGFARSALEWLPRVEARFAWSVDGERHDVTLGPGDSLTLTLTASQRASFELDPVDGELFIASSWLGEARYDELAQDPSVTIERTVSPAGHAPADDLVRVTLKVHLSDPLENTCYQVTDLLPSGLAPVVAPWWSHWDPEVIGPYEAEGQRVSWCIGTDRADVTLGYTARVVSPGRYRWEPAIIQAVAAPTIGSATPVISYTID